MRDFLMFPVHFCDALVSLFSGIADIWMYIFCLGQEEQDGPGPRGPVQVNINLMNGEPIDACEPDDWRDRLEHWTHCQDCDDDDGDERTPA